MQEAGTGRCIAQRACPGLDPGPIGTLRYPPLVHIMPPPPPPKISEKPRKATILDPGAWKAEQSLEFAEREGVLKARGIS